MLTKTKLYIYSLLAHSQLQLTPNLHRCICFHLSSISNIYRITVVLLKLSITILSWNSVIHFWQQKSSSKAFTSSCWEQRERNSPSERINLLQNEAQRGQPSASSCWGKGLNWQKKSREITTEEWRNKKSITTSTQTLCYCR